MIVAGVGFSGAPLRPAVSVAGTADAEMPKPQKMGHFREISAISPSSLASAYQVIRSREAAIAAPVPSGHPAILSGLGVPAAIDAYQETGTAV